MPESVLLEVNGADVSFGGVRALWDVSMAVGAGTVTGLIGPNGAGKTTLFNVITGLQPPGRGQVVLDGRHITRLRAHKRARLGVGRTFQRLELFGTLTARENVLMAAETAWGRGGAGGARSGPASAAELADSLIERVGIGPVADEPTDLLPTGLARLVELARALATRPRLLLLDEPSSGLDHDETDELGRVLRDVAGEGVGVLLVEHDMRLVMSVCTRVTVLDFGRVIAHGEPEAVRADPVVQAAYLGAPEERLPEVVGESGRGDPPSSGDGRGGGGRPAVAKSEGTDASDALAASALAAASRGPVIELVDAKASYGRIEVVHGVSLSLGRGKVLALLGPNGAGKSSLLKLASGRLTPTAGSVRFRGADIRGRSPQSLARDGLCTIPEGRPIFPNLTVAENILMYTYRSSDMRAADLEEQAFARFPVLGERRRQLAGTLSGGEQQMLAIARALSTRPEVLLVDELSMGLAPLVVEQLYEAVASLVAAEGLAVLMVEQFAETALGVADRAAVMVNGLIEVEGTPAEVGQQVVRAYMGTASG